MMKNRVKVTIAALAIGVLAMCGNMTGYATESASEVSTQANEDRSTDAGGSNQNIYTVTYDLNGGTKDGEKTYKPSYNSESWTVDLSKITPERDGYRLTGWWYTDTNNTEKEISTSEKIELDKLFPNTREATLTAEWTQVVTVTVDRTNAGTVAAGNMYSVTPAASDKLTLDKWVVNNSADVVTLGNDKSGSITIKAATAEKHVINIDGEKTGFGITKDNAKANFVSYWRPKDEYYLVEVTNKTGHPLKFNHETIENDATAGVELFGIEKGFPEKTGDNYFTILNRSFDYYIKDQAGDYTLYNGHNVKFYTVTLNEENVKRNIVVKYKKIDGVEYTYTVELNKEIKYNSEAISPQDLLDITVTGGKVEAKKDGFTKYRWTYFVKDINGNSIAAENIPTEAWVDSPSENILEKKFDYSFPYYEFEFVPVWQGDVNFKLDIPADESATTPGAIEGKDVGTTITLPEAPEIEGYTFNGWKVDVASDTVYKPESSYEITSANITFTGSWTANTYNITWKLGDNEPTLDPTNVIYKSQAELPIPEKTGYTFTGWKSNIDGDNTLYNKEKPFKMPSHDVTMTAQWEINTYTVTYDGNGGTIGIYTGEDTVTYNDSYTIQQTSGITPTRFGYKFLGWKINGEGDLLQADSSFTMPAKDVTLVAQWESTSSKNYNMKKGVGYTHDGAFRIKGDPNNYQDKITFYVPDDKEYTFE